MSDSKRDKKMSSPPQPEFRLRDTFLPVDIARTTYIALFDYMEKGETPKNAKETLDQLIAVLLHDGVKEDFKKLGLYPNILKNKKHEKHFNKPAMEGLEKKNPLWNFIAIHDAMEHGDIKSVNTLRKEGLSPKTPAAKKKKGLTPAAEKKSASPPKSATPSASRKSAGSSPKMNTPSRKSATPSAAKSAGGSSPKKSASPTRKSAGSPPKSASASRRASVAHHSRDVSDNEEEVNDVMPNSPVIIDTRETNATMSPIEELLSANTKSLRSPESSQSLARGQIPVRGSVNSALTPGAVARRRML